MSSKFLNLSTDNTLGGNSPSETKAVSEKAIKEYVDNNAGQTYVAGTGLQLSDQNEFNILQQDISGLPYKEISDNITIAGDIYSFPYVGSSGNANTKIELYPPLSITSNDTVEIQFLYKVASTGNRCLFNAYDSTNTTYSCLRLFVGGGNRHNSRTIDFNLNGTSIKITPTAAQLNNKTYNNNWWYIRIILEPNAQTVDISDDGENWNNIISNTSSAVYNKTFDNIIIGNETVIAQPYAETFYGDIDFSKSFIKINGNIWWSGKGDVAKSVAKATSSLYGLVKPDNTSITVNDGVLSGNIGTVTSVNNVQPVNGNVTLDIPTNFVTTNTAQDISGKKTFLGEKAILFKQNENTNKLGFTLYNPSSTELGAFEWRPSTIGGGALLNINVPYASSNYVGFRYWGTAVNIIAPKVATAGNYYIPTHFTDGTNTVSANSSGVVSLSTLLPAEVTESTVSGWGFTKNTGTVTSVNNIQPVNGNVTLTIPVVEEYTASEVETLWESL